ncbi:glycoside hydrolase family 76 protein [Xylariaceae sp. FL0662B]|nr:glycoside hydrolase family 76 protein [Xylariaceae sp. FL0662B]
MVQAQLRRLSLIRVVYSLVLSAGNVGAYDAPVPKHDQSPLAQECSVFSPGRGYCDSVAHKSFLPSNVATISKDAKPHSPDLGVLADLLDAMNVMQADFFAPWLGTWPESIDWTAAVMGTHISGATRSLSEASGLFSLHPDSVIDWKLKSNIVDNYFTQLTGYYFGQDAFSIRNEAYDDILWVVLGWLETVQLLNTHTDLHFTPKPRDKMPELQMDADIHGIRSILSNQTYHGNIWIPAFSHRARIFWDLASHGWDTKLCGGGMIWNPRLLPYKNAITNELYIAASISMYLHFPGDSNQSPFYSSRDTMDPEDPELRAQSEPRDAKYLKAAVDGYKWLVNSNMTDNHGLYTDGFHISGYGESENNNTKCDERDNVVLSYNQGVLLTGLRGLWEATGAWSYLIDGHRLIQNVINASGYDLASDSALDDISALDLGVLPPWRGLGRAGVMEDPCDASGTCSQDGQTFKGIFFHHLTAFCAPLVLPPISSDTGVNIRAFNATKESHSDACAAYGGWLKHNARAALNTRDKAGRFGQWWTAGLLVNWTGPWPTMANDGVPRDANSVDYRNYGVPNDSTWRDLPPANGDSNTPAKTPLSSPEQKPKQKPLGDSIRVPLPRINKLKKRDDADTEANKDPNTRGRGRTVETQGGGLALLRAYWKIAQAP